MAYEYIIVGAGTAGCLLANRLSEDPSVKVLLLEAGPEPRGLWTRLWTSMPAGGARLAVPGPLNWGFSTEPEPHLNGRKMYAPRGRGLGGSSLINGMAFFRAQPEDFDSWSKSGVNGWNWSDILPYYKKLEHREGGDAAFRGRSGELWVTDPLFQHASSKDFIKAGVNAGIALNEDFNGARREGVGPIQFTIRDGERHSSAKAFLDPARSRPNLHVMTDAQVHRVVLDSGTATGVEIGRGNRTEFMSASREVILCAGAFGSPALLQLSGIGPAADLQRLGIAVARDLPGVGRNLQDHLSIHLAYRSTPESSMNGGLRGWRTILHGIQYLLTHKGPLTIGHSQACVFVRSFPDVERADVQINFRPLSYKSADNGALKIRETPEVTASVCFLRPESRGSVTLASKNASDAPLIRANYFAAPRDQAVGVAAVKQIRRLLATEPMASRITGEIEPGPDCSGDEGIIDYIRRTARSMHHWVGTCSMGTGSQAVVDERLRVHGVGRLRVIDASVMPAVTSANTNAPTFVLAERSADLLRQP